MAQAFHWHSYQGTLTSDNRDYCGIAEREDAKFYAVLDGATSGPDGAALAKELACYLVDGFFDERPPVTKTDICGLLAQAHEKLRCRYPSDSASYFILIQPTSGPALTLHAGDCRLGKLNQDNSVSWLNAIHCLANATAPMTDAEIAVHPNRHQLTRSFRPRKFQEPEAGEYSIGSNETFVIATDGFWAELNAAQQTQLLEGQFVSSGEDADDISVLVLKAEPSVPDQPRPIGPGSLLVH
jgi:serine/threonine protein phosphatase PrpC